jgi:Holliday junction resolvasome RuvABC endonuclease subunit
MYNCFVGIDPGVSGGIAFYWKGMPDRVTAEDLPVIAGRISSVLLAERILQMAPDVAIIEEVGAMPGQGVSSTFKFGYAAGSIAGVIAALKIPYRRVSPSTLRKYWKIPGGREGKDKSRALAVQLFPACADLFSRKKDHNRADAALLARYGAEVWATE